MTWTQWPELTGFIYSDLSAMAYIVPLIFAAFILVFVAVALTMASQARFACPRCTLDFTDRESLARHIRQAHALVRKVAGKSARTERPEERKAA